MGVDDGDAEGEEPLLPPPPRAREAGENLQPGQLEFRGRVDIDVRVDLHPEAVTELRRVLEEFKLYEGFYRDRGHRPDLAMTQDQFVATLAKR